jgi:superoxide dismutase
LQHLAPPGSAATQTSAISAPLKDAINASFGTLDNMTAELTTAASKVFGSGWAWLCYTGAVQLAVREGGVCSDAYRNAAPHADDQQLAVYSTG